MRVLCGTGHRPEDSEDEKIVRIKSRVALQRANPERYISGMASGFDLWSADEAINLGIEVTAAVPWFNHKPRVGDEELYARIIEAASDVEYVTRVDKYPGAWVYPTRNHWMVDHADAVMAYWNTQKQTGGTYECYKYAKKKQKPIRNIFYDPPF